MNALLAIIVASVTQAPTVAHWRPAKYWQGAPLRSCQRWLDGTVCCGYRDERCGYVVCNGVQVAWSRGCE
jgi:hypothetical protein